MNRHSQNLHRLLHDIVPATETDLGPDRDALLNMLRQERSRRHRIRLTWVAGLSAIVGALLLLRPTSHSPHPAAANAPAPLVIHEVDDQQLLALMQNTPAALMEWPNGERTLLVLEP